ncbi:MAG: glutamate racemase [Gemmatimonadota bacterium]
MSETADRPIGVFDSGIGGLTVVRELVRRLPNESVIYFGDTARVPYGPKSPETIRRYAREAAALLLQRGVKTLVVACNTATAHAEEALAAELSVPVVGVVDPGARAAARSTRTARVGVLGTTGTIASGVYDRRIRELLPDARVFAQPCPLFVPLAEEGMADHEAARLIALHYLQPVRDLNVDVAILGCTHYPILRPLIADALGPGVQLVDSGAETAAAIEAVLASAGLLRADSTPPAYEYIVSDSPGRFREVGSRFVGAPIDRAVLLGAEVAADG